MPRAIDITVPANQSSKLIGDIQSNVEGIISVKLYKGASVKPSGDIVSVEIANKYMSDLMSLLYENKIGSTDGTSITSSKPLSIISRSSNDQILTDTSESSWEEADQTMVSESNATINMLVIMFAAGAIAAIGIATNAIHIVIGAMVIAPAFEPVLRIPLAMVSHNRMVTRALVVNARIYASLIAGSVTATLTLWMLNGEKFGVTSSYLSSFSLLNYWSHITVTSIIVSTLAGIAGALLVITNRSVLALGSMIALALIPSAALFGIGLVHLDTSLMISGASRWIIDVLLVILSGFAVFSWKKKTVHKRKAMPYKS